jgi:hypothetical protein
LFRNPEPLNIQAAGLNPDGWTPELSIVQNGVFHKQKINIFRRMKGFVPNRRNTAMRLLQRCLDMR